MSKILRPMAGHILFTILSLGLVLAPNHIWPGCTPILAATSYDGEWTGTTDQGYDMSFSVSDNRVTSWTIKMVVTGSKCTATTSYTLGFTPGKLISENGFSFKANFDNDEFTGVFTTPTDCSGTWQSRSEYCEGTSSGTWVAHKSVKQLTPDIKANGSDSATVLPSGSPVSITIALEPGEKADQNADWWIAVNTSFDPPLDWYSYTYPGQWKSGVNLCIQTPLFPLSAFEVLNMALPAGHYTFYFAIDDADGLPVGPWWGIDWVEVTIE